MWSDSPETLGQVMGGPDADTLVAEVHGDWDGNHDECEANASLIASAPDHALYARAVTAGVARWEPFGGSDNRGEVCCGGLRYSTVLDVFGVPCLSSAMRSALAKKVGAL